MSVDGIAAASTALSQAKVAQEAAVRVAKLAQRQDQVTAQFVTESMEALQQMVAQFAADMGGHIDTYA